MNPRAVKIICVLVLATVGVLAGVWMSGKSSSGRGTVPDVARDPAALALDAAEFKRPSDSGGVAQVVADTRRSALASLDSLPPADRLDNVRGVAMVTAAEEWLRLLLAPDYNQYSAMVAERTGASLDESSVEADWIQEDKWLLLASDFADMAIAPTDAVVQPWYVEGRDAGRPQPGVGHITERKDPGIYTRIKDPVKQGADVYSLTIPVIVNNVRSGEPTQVWLHLALIWDRTSKHWLPWRVSLHDPEDGRSALPAPWL